MKIVVLHQPHPMGNYKLNVYIAEYLRSLGHEVYALQQLNGHPLSQEYTDIIKSVDPDVLYFEMLDIETFKAVEQFDCEKVLVHASRGVLDSFDSILEYEGKWFTKLMTNSKHLYDKWKLPNSEHFEFYPAPIHQSEVDSTIDLQTDIVFLGQGFARRTSPDYTKEREVFFDNSKISKAIFGIGWDGQEGYRGVLGPDDIGKLYSSATSAFAMIAKSQREMGQINNRYCELAFCETPIISLNYSAIDWFGADKYINFVSSAMELEELVGIIVAGDDAIIKKAQEFKPFIESKEQEFFSKLESLI